MNSKQISLTHRPPHIYLKQCPYFFTGATFDKENFFSSNNHKLIFIKILKESLERFNLRIYAWVVLSNHYHFLIDFTQKEGSDGFGDANFSRPSFNSLLRTNNTVLNQQRSSELSETKFAPADGKTIIVEFIRKLHKDSARKINQLDNTPGRQVWYQYWDRCISTEKDFWKHFNYIHHNPVKHGIYQEQYLAANYQFCSYKDWLKKKGQEWLESCFATYPIADFTLREHD